MQKFLLHLALPCLLKILLLVYTLNYCIYPCQLFLAESINVLFQPFQVSFEPFNYVYNGALRLPCHGVIAKSLFRLNGYGINPLAAMGAYRIFERPDFNHLPVTHHCTMGAISHQPSLSLSP